MAASPCKPILPLGHAPPTADAASTATHGVGRSEGALARAAHVPWPRPPDRSDRTKCRHLAKPLQVLASVRSMKAGNVCHAVALLCRFDGRAQRFRRATPALLFQHPAGQFCARAWGLAYTIFYRQYFLLEDTPIGSRACPGIVKSAGMTAKWKN